MGLLNLEHSKTVYIADFVIYGVVVTALSAYLLIAGPRAEWLTLLLLVLAGLVSWSIIEYVLHRFVLHHLQPFTSWHAEHHKRPMALICSPTIFTGGLFFVLVFWPAWAIGGQWSGTAFTLGILIGYLLYAIAHHATHHWRASNAWFRYCKRWHALHHHVGSSAYFGVTTPIWDYVFLSARRKNLDE